jgi:hypothetical protein
MYKNTLLILFDQNAIHHVPGHRLALSKGPVTEGSSSPLPPEEGDRFNL